MIKRSIIVCGLILMIILHVGCNNADIDENKDNDFTVEGLTEKEIIQTFKDQGIKLKQSDMQIKDKYILEEVKPKIYELNDSNDYLFIYIFKSLNDRERSEMDREYREIYKDFCVEENLGWLASPAKNALIIHIPNAPKENDDEEYKKYFMRLKEIKRIVFEDLNDAKEIVFKGETENWKGEYKVMYYEYFMQYEEGRIGYDSYEETTGELVYKGNRKNVETINYEYEISAGSGGSGTRHLNKDGKLSLGTTGGSGSITRKDSVIKLKIQWNGKTEIMELKAIT